MEIKSCAGFEYIFVPGETDAPFTLLLLHGTGGNEESLLPLARVIAPNANYISPRGPVLEGSHHRFFARKDEGIFDENEIRNRAVNLAKFCQEVVIENNLTETKIIALGFSNGANIAAAMMLTGDSDLSGAILLRAMPTLSSSSLSPLSNIPILLLSGTDDELVTEGQARDLAEQLKTARANVEHIFINGGHTGSETDVQEARTWLNNNFSL